MIQRENGEHQKMYNIFKKFYYLPIHRMLKHKLYLMIWHD